MTKAFIFPGQGSQYVGMGSDLYNILENAKLRYTSAADILGYNLAEISFQGPEKKLRETQFAQPAIFVHSIIINDYLKENGIFPNAVAGHSLGEFSALVSAEILSFEDALKIIKVRSQEMSQAAKINPGKMAAIIGANEEQLKIICTQKGVVVPANLNAIGQVVISGEIDAVNNALSTAKGLGIRRIVPLNVSGAFHSPLMAPAREPLQKIINSVSFHRGTVPIYQNVVAEPVTDIEKIKKNILNQLEKPVLWINIIRQIIQNGMINFFEIGPGNILSGLNRRITKETNTYNFDKMEHLNGYAML